MNWTKVNKDTEFNKPFLYRTKNGKIGTCANRPLDQWFINKYSVEWFMSQESLGNPEIEFEPYQETGYIEVSSHVRVGGKVFNDRTKIYSRGRASSHFDIDSLASHLFMIDRQIGSGSTYADEVLQEIIDKKLLKNPNNYTARDLMNKWWVKTDDIEKLFVEEIERMSEVYPSAKEYIESVIVNKVISFQKSPMIVKQGFLYWFWKYLMNESIDEILEDFKNIPQNVIDFIDANVVKRDEKPTA